MQIFLSGVLARYTPLKIGFGSRRSVDSSWSAIFKLKTMIPQKTVSSVRWRTETTRIIVQSCARFYATTDRTRFSLCKSGSDSRVGFATIRKIARRSANGTVNGTKTLRDRRKQSRRVRRLCGFACDATEVLTRGGHPRWRRCRFLRDFYEETRFRNRFVTVSCCHLWFTTVTFSGNLVVIM